MQSMIKGWAQRNKFGVYVRHHIIKWCKFMIAFLVKWSKAIINYRHHLVSTDGNRIINRRIFGLLVFQGPLSFLNIFLWSIQPLMRWLHASYFNELLPVVIGVTEHSNDVPLQIVTAIFFRMHRATFCWRKNIFMLWIIFFC